jgi:hypothetical protein
MAADVVGPVVNVERCPRAIDQAAPLVDMSAADLARDPARHLRPRSQPAVRRRTRHRFRQRRQLLRRQQRPRPLVGAAPVAQTVGAAGVVATDQDLDPTDRVAARRGTLLPLAISQTMWKWLRATESSAPRYRSRRASTLKYPSICIRPVMIAPYLGNIPLRESRLQRINQEDAVFCLIGPIGPLPSF